MGKPRASWAQNGTNIGKLSNPHRRPARSGHKITVASEHCAAVVGRPLGRRLSYINISNNDGMGWLRSAAPPVCFSRKRSRVHCFVSFAADLSRDGALQRAGEAPSVRPVPAHIDQHYTTNITDRHQHYRLSRPFLRSAGI